MALFSSSSNSYLGIDIGSTSIKIVELKKEKGEAKLVNYGFSENKNILDTDWQKDTKHTARIISKILDESDISGRNAIAALPTFSVFSSVLNLSNIAKKDIASAVQWEAKKVIPLPLEDMILDWKRVDEQGDDKEEKNKNEAKKGDIKILLTGAPRPLVKNYIDVFKNAKINLVSLETETFSLVRSLLGNDKSTNLIVEMGASTTDISIIDKSIPMLTRSIDVGGNIITKAISTGLNIGLDRAEQFKYDLGVGGQGANESVPKIIIDTISPLINEIKYAINLYQSKHNKKIEKLIISGGSAFLRGLSTYLTDLLDTKVLIGDPWSRVSCPVDLKPLLDEIGPRMSVAIGLALREIS